MKLREKSKNYFFYILKFTDEKRLFSVGSASGSASQRYGSEDPDPHPYQNVKDSEHWPKLPTYKRWVKVPLPVKYIDWKLPG